MTARKRISFAAGALVISGITWAGFRIHSGAGIPPLYPPAENSFVGRSDMAVSSILGTPDAEFAGHYGNPGADFTNKFSGEIKTTVFRKLGGEVYVTFEKRNGVWISICNSWLSKGSVY